MRCFPACPHPSSTPCPARRKSADVQLLGFFWTASQLVMVTGAGLELHSVHPSLQALRLDATLPLQVGAAIRTLEIAAACDKCS